MKDFPYIEATDLPADRNGSLGKVRREVRLVYNHNRNSVEKLELLATTLRYVLNKIDEGMKTPDRDNKSETTLHFRDKAIASAEVTPGFTPTVVAPKPTVTKRAAQRTTKKDK